MKINDILGSLPFVASLLFLAALFLWMLNRGRKWTKTEALARLQFYRTRISEDFAALSHLRKRAQLIELGATQFSGKTLGLNRQLNENITEMAAMKSTAQNTLRLAEQLVAPGNLRAKIINLFSTPLSGRHRFDGVGAARSS